MTGRGGLADYISKDKEGNIKCHISVINKDIKIIFDTLIDNNVPVIYMKFQASIYNSVVTPLC